MFFFFVVVSVRVVELLEYDFLAVLDMPFVSPRLHSAGTRSNIFGSC
jgi:hypothetical protein